MHSSEEKPTGDDLSYKKQQSTLSRQQSRNLLKNLKEAVKQIQQTTTDVDEEESKSKIDDV